MRRALAILSLALAAIPAGALAAVDTAAEARAAQVEALRGEIANQIQLQAYDLLDELVYGWLQQPVFPIDTPVVLADVSAPVGFGSGLQALIETHFTSLIIKNPATHVVLAHCPQCSALVVHSGAKGTVVARGVDEPEALSSAGALSGAKHALFLDFEVEGSSLVLRARVTSLQPALPIVYARTLSSSTSSPALLRGGDRLKSAAEARQEYLDALAGRSVYLIPLHFGLRSYASPPSGSTAQGLIAPLFWLEAGVEAPLTQARAWTGSFTLGATWAPMSHAGWMAQVRVARLLSGTVSSLTLPDLYGFVGASIISLNGSTALAFSENVPSIENIIAADRKTDPHAIFPALQVGLELRVKNRIGVAVFLENLPTMNSPSIGKYLDYSILQFQTFGAEVTFCF